LRQALALDPITAAFDGLAILDAALSASAIVDDHLAKAGLLVAAARFAEAQVELEAALRLEPGYPPALNNLGAVRASSGDFSAAEVYFRAALAKKPDFAEAHNNLGHILIARGDLEGAQSAYREALRLKPDSTEYLANLRGVRQRPDAAAR
jgi:Flp pilus assembly protein TadD